jgi:hypothetical protein
MKRIGDREDPIWKTFIENTKPAEDNDKAGEDDHKDKDLEHN